VHPLVFFEKLQVPNPFGFLLSKQAPYSVRNILGRQYLGLGADLTANGDDGNVDAIFLVGHLE